LIADGSFLMAQLRVVIAEIKRDSRQNADDFIATIVGDARNQEIIRTTANRRPSLETSKYRYILLFRHVISYERFLRNCKSATTTASLQN